MRALLVVLMTLPGFAAQPATVKVGSKQFTESVILGEVAVDLLRSEGIDAEHRRELGGTRILWEALVRGEIDVYPEYTGTLRAELLPGVEDLGAALAERGLRMTAPLGFENSYAMGMRAERAKALGVTTLSELARAGDVKLGLSNEFISRKDGWPTLIERYGFAANAAQGLDHDLAYRALQSGAIDATDLYSTDAEIKQYGLITLIDDRNAFPEYAAVLVYRAGVPERAEAALQRLERAMTERDMIDLNARAKLERVSEQRVAAEYVERRFGVASEVVEESVTARVLRRTREHLWLVAVSLGAAILFGVPLGVLAARRRRLGAWLLSAAGLLQTIPSLALLVFMIPLLGIGAQPAIAALFLYSLLPVIRGTHTGLTSLAPEIRDSAEALGLSGWQRLRLVELPLATRSILSGVKVAAVINVGTATVGALIGAGGYGQPILTGIRLADTALILEGAIPAAVLALLVQGAFDLVERRLLPEALRG